MNEPGKASDGIVVASSRITRLITALAAASIERIEEALRFQVEGDDEFSTLEGSFVVFLNDLHEARTKSENALRSMEASRDELATKLVTIEQQRLTIRELSTPILDLWEGILTLPVVGVIDTQRAVEMTERLLSRIVDTGARAVILDITGVDVVDTSTADHLVRLTRAAGMLGAHCVVTGIGPNVARTLVSMGVDLGGVQTLRTLRDGLKTCLERTGTGHR